MSFTQTPYYIQYIPELRRDPITNLWILPSQTFNLVSPYDYEPLDQDSNYRKNIVSTVFTQFKERWLYKESIYRKLMKYFKVTGDDDKKTVSVISKVGKSSVVDYPDQKYVLKYIEKMFVTKKLVRKSIQDYMKRSKIKWYDVLVNKEAIKEAIYRRLRKIIGKIVLLLESSA